MLKNKISTDVDVADLENRGTPFCSLRVFDESKMRAVQKPPVSKYSVNRKSDLPGRPGI
jgi:hypothetical protein